jgi:hypothetical protein
VEYYNGLSINELDYYFLLSKMNVAMEAACDGECFYLNLTDNFFWEATDFYDLYHTTPKGSEKVAKVIFEELVSKDFRF